MKDKTICFKKHLSNIQKYKKLIINLDSCYQEIQFISNLCYKEY